MGQSSESTAGRTIGATPSYELVKAAYYAVEYDGEHVDVEALTAAERQVWQAIAERDRRRRELTASMDYEAADREFPEGWSSV